MKDIFSGEDGKPSGRRVIGTGLILLGSGLLIVGQLQTGDVVGRIAPGSIALLAGALFWGLVTWQNIQDAAKAVKGGQ
jgi:drug/metabolite transporter (DMT)-like permease